MNETNLPLSGITVIELATVVAAPSAARMLCAYGAKVIKIESLSGDVLRFAGVQLQTPCTTEKNPVFAMHNSGKQFVSLNIKHPDGIAILHELLKEADVFITNLRPLSLQKLGLDYETLQHQYPQLIYASFLGYGEQGTEAGAPGYDATCFWMRSGAVADWVEPGAFPFKPAYGFGDISSSMSLLSGILMALLGRQKSGKGTMVTTSLFANGIWCNGNGIIQSQFAPTMSHDPLYPSNPFSNYYRCGDGRWIGLCCNNYVGEKEKYARALEMEDILTDPRYENYDTLRQTGAVTEGVLRCKEIFRTRSSVEWKSFLTKCDIACEIVKHTNEVPMDEQAIANGYVSPMQFTDSSEVTMPMPPVHFSEYDCLHIANPGAVGSDTNVVLNALGYTDEEIAKLREMHVIR